jgi:hypothetical protein
MNSYKKKAARWAALTKSSLSGSAAVSGFLLALRLVVRHIFLDTLPDIGLLLGFRVLACLLALIALLVRIFLIWIGH